MIMGIDNRLCYITAINATSEKPPKASRDDSAVQLGLGDSSS